jgi:phage baseplate assembly protein W
MSRTTDLEKITRVAGRDLQLDYVFGGGLFEDADLATTERSTRAALARDLAVVEGIDALRQAIVNRLKTRKGELAPLGHPDYGSRHHELIGEPNVERTRDLIKLYVLQALRAEPRILRVLEARVSAEHVPPRETVRIELKLEVARDVTPLNLVIPFSLEVTL